MIDLSHRPSDEKSAYIRAVLAALNEIRRRTGLSHRILLDEAHYFLHDACAPHLLDLERNGYTAVTYWASRLPHELLAATEVIITTRQSNPTEVEALRRWCPTGDAVADPGWALLGQLRTGQAVALPITEEASGGIQLVSVGPRLTPHVRHREKYVDIPVAEHRAFEFQTNGKPSHRARTLRQFVSILERVPPARLEGFLRRGDFSRWIGDVFGDYPLAAELRALEQRHHAAASPETVAEIAAAIRGRYDLTHDDLLPAAS